MLLRLRRHQRSSDRTASASLFCLQRHSRLFLRTRYILHDLLRAAQRQTAHLPEYRLLPHRKHSAYNVFRKYVQTGCPQRRYSLHFLLPAPPKLTLPTPSQMTLPAPVQLTLPARSIHARLLLPQRSPPDRQTAQTAVRRQYLQSPRQRSCWSGS